MINYYLLVVFIVIYLHFAWCTLNSDILYPRSGFSLLYLSFGGQFVSFILRLLWFCLEVMLKTVKLLAAGVHNRSDHLKSHRSYQYKSCYYFLSGAKKLYCSNLALLRRPFNYLQWRHYIYVKLLHQWACTTSTVTKC